MTPITTIRRSVTKQCPFKDETDTGELVITFYGDVPELHALAAQVDELCVTPISHEDFSEAVQELVGMAEVSTSWTTGPWLVEVRT